VVFGIRQVTRNSVDNNYLHQLTRTRIQGPRSSVSGTPDVHNTFNIKKKKQKKHTHTPTCDSDFFWFILYFYAVYVRELIGI
jgi:hypothetical protein